MKKRISFSLWGDNPVYTEGAVRNAELSPEVYPGWEPVFYIDTLSVPERIVRRLKELAIVREKTGGNWLAMLWRFEEAGGQGVERVIFRDTDSRIGEREAAAVREWESSCRAVHVMRDHPSHDAPIMGGMWGILGNLHVFVNKLKLWKGRDRYQVDQNFLRGLWPELRKYALVHDSIRGLRPFPVPRKGLEFVGEPVQVDGTPLDPKHRDLLRRCMPAAGVRK